MWQLLIRTELTPERFLAMMADDDLCILLWKRTLLHLDEAAVGETPKTDLW